MSRKSMILIFNILLKTSGDGIKLLDSTFNGLSDIYPDFEAASISATLENPFKIYGFREVNEHLGCIPNMIDGYDIQVDAFTCTQEVCNYEAQCICK